MKGFIKNEKLLESHTKLLKLSQSRSETNWLLANDSFKQIFMVLSRQILMNNEVLLRLRINESEFC